MTCIVGYLDKKTNKVTIGADSAGVGGYDISIRKDVKVFKNKDFIIGCTSSFRMIQLLRFKFVPPFINDKDIYEYMCTDFVDTIRQCFKDGGFIQKDKEVESGGTFLVAYKDRLFVIYDDFQVGETANGINACGCGEDYAKGAMFQLNDLDITTNQKVTKALESAAFFSAGVCAPFHLLTT